MWVLGKVLGCLVADTGTLRAGSGQGANLGAGRGTAQHSTTLNAVLAFRLFLTEVKILGFLLIVKTGSNIGLS